MKIKIHWTKDNIKDEAIFEAPNLIMIRNDILKFMEKRNLYEDKNQMWTEEIN